ncbi:hypothetical protein IFM89_030561 [Coptis chinensis]|uniref:Uncharacterized protein n=1 Tax=Coptis chinensis TaxID=261450 RepID=A0A835HR23_9MAGN|nr:hypothetical protein IFM89_030561 [Coptis chinensis]
MVTNVPSLLELLFFHKGEIQLYNRIVGSLRKNSSLAKQAMSFWFCMEELGYFDLVENIILADDTLVEIIFNETMSCLECVGPNARHPSEDTDEVVAMSEILNEPIRRRFIYFNRDTIFNRMNHFLNTVCNLIFNENAAVPTFYARGESSTQGQVSRPSSSLDPSARPFSSNVPPEYRTMFLTFSHGYPIPKEEILEFFAKRWGDVVEDLIFESIEGKPEKTEPEYANLVFKSILTIPLILNGKQKVKYNIKGKHLWCRIFVPRPSS